MTIESRGQSYTFDGYLTQTDIKAESDEFYDNYDMMARVVPRAKFTVDLSIQVIGSIEQATLPTKANRHVQ